MIGVCKVVSPFFAPPVLLKGRNNVFDILYKNQLFNLVPELSYKLIILGFIFNYILALAIILCAVFLRTNN